MGNSVYWGKYRGRLADEVARYVPPGWTTDVRDVAGRREVDAFLVLRGGGERVAIAVEFKSELTPKSADEAWRRLAGLNEPGLLVAPHISAKTQAYLRDSGMSYLDFAGNVWWRLESPALAVSVTSDAPPPKQALRRRLRGAKAGRLVRYLCDVRPPFTVTALAAKLSIDMGNVSRYLDLLHRDGLLERGPRGAVSNVDWEGLLRRWSDDYRRPVQERYLDPRGQDHFLQQLRGTRKRYALSGVAGASRYAAFTADIATYCYCDDLHGFAKSHGLHPADRTANVILAVPFDEVVYDRVRKRDDVIVAAPTQIAVDLLTASGRELQQGEELIRWMRENEDAWRSP
jgi:hypothetical protein